MIHKVLMFGDSEWSDGERIRKEVKRLTGKYGTTNLLIISGGAPGADILSEVAAGLENVHCAVIKALWTTRYRGAGPQRNQMMGWLEPNEAICFHPDLARSKGSKDMKRRLDKASVPVKVVAR